MVLMLATMLVKGEIEAVFSHQSIVVCLQQSCPFSASCLPNNGRMTESAPLLLLFRYVHHPHFPRHFVCFCHLGTCQPPVCTFRFSSSYGQYNAPLATVAFVARKGRSKHNNNNSTTDICIVIVSFSVFLQGALHQTFLTFSFLFFLFHFIVPLHGGYVQAGVVLYIFQKKKHTKAEGSRVVLG